ncbi:MAG TPA: thiamine pyrophosphate-dependent enzyme [Chlamydiales bacterium]|nr:thiamine pyrophosphate-dependent enzyme [Chlamydiales bacterium]
MIAIGTRLSQQITGGKQELFAPKAKKVMIDIDPEELLKFSKEPFALDLSIHSDLNNFFHAFEPFYAQDKVDLFQPWRELMQKWKVRYPVCTPSDEQQKGLLNPYVFIKALSRVCKEGEIIVTDTGANICWMMQAFETKKNQRIFSAWNHTPMGYSLPASLGAALGASKPVVCLIGDGGLMMCLQELATLSRYNLPVKVFIFDNNGHATMKQTLEVWLNAQYAAVDEDSGLSFPDYKKLADSFGLPYAHLKMNDTLTQDLSGIWNIQGPLVCRLEIDPAYRIVPFLKFGGGLESLGPMLSQEEVDMISDEAEKLCALRGC